MQYNIMPSFFQLKIKRGGATKATGEGGDGTTTTTTASAMTTQGYALRITMVFFSALLVLQFQMMVRNNNNGDDYLSDYLDYATSGESIFAPMFWDEKSRESNGEGKKGNEGEGKEYEPMNVVIIYPDDWRHDSLEDARPGLIHTPFLTQLAKEGIRFSHNAVTTSICWISRATLFTGRYAGMHLSLRLKCPIFTDFEFWQHSWPYRLMHEKGYFVGQVGKWQYHNGNTFFSHAFNWSRIHEGLHWYNDRDPINRKPVKIHAADKGRNDAIDFLRERPKDRPFAMTVAFYPPKPVGDGKEPGAAWSPKDEFYDMYRDHEFIPPYNFTQAFEALPPFLQSGIARNRYMNRYSTQVHFEEGMKRYFALVSQVDQASKEIIDELKQQGVYNNTMIIFTTDNGLMQGAHGLAGKWHPYEESIRVPLIIRDPRMPMDKRGTVDDSFTLNIDLASTILGAAGLKPSPIMQGRDIADLYMPKSSSSSSSSLKSTIRNGPWREDFYYEFPLGEFPGSIAVVTKEWKYVQWPTKDYEQLFHLKTDPYELNDLLRGVSTTTTTNSSSTTSSSTTTTIKNSTTGGGSGSGGDYQEILSVLRKRLADLEDAAISPNNITQNRPTCEKREYGVLLEPLSTF